VSTYIKVTGLDKKISICSQKLALTLTIVAVVIVDDVHIT